MTNDLPANTEAVRKTTGMIFDVKRYAIHDGPGIRTTVFLKGCPLRCKWCHNPESWSREREHSLRTALCAGCGHCAEACPTGAISMLKGTPVSDPSKCDFCGQCVEACPTGACEILGREVTVKQIMAEVRRDAIFHEESGGGVTVSGGEPLMQPEFLEELLTRCKTEGIHTALDTAGYAPWKLIERVADRVDLFLIDLKHMDPQAHERLTGVSNEQIIENLRRLSRHGCKIIIRMPIIPGANDDDANIRACGEFLSSLSGVVRVDVLPYNQLIRHKLTRLANSYDAPSYAAPAAEHVRSIAGRLKNCGLDVSIGG